MMRKMITGYSNERIKNKKKIPNNVITVIKFLIIVFVLTYDFSPIDLVPDVVFPVGYTDDVVITIIGLVVQYYIKQIGENKNAWKI